MCFDLCFIDCQRHAKIQKKSTQLCTEENRTHERNGLLSHNLLLNYY